MTKENRERAYLHFRDLEKNYLAPPHLNYGLTSTSNVKARAKKNADNLLAKRPELAELEKPKKEEKKPEPKPEEVEEEKVEECEKLKEEGLSEAEAQGTVWPEEKEEPKPKPTSKKKEEKKDGGK